MSLTVFVILWDSIKLLHYKREYGRGRQSIVQSRDIGLNNFSVDCKKTINGLFIGIFALLLTIISIILYFIYMEKEAKIAIIISEITQVSLLVPSLFVIIAIFITLKKSGYKYRNQQKMCYNSLLTIVGLAGVYLYGLYSIIALITLKEKTYVNIISLFIQIFSIIESTLQSGLIINGLKMHSEDILNLKNKPGRSLITLLILLNLCMWLSENMRFKNYDMNIIQMDYYGIVFWSTVNRILSPLSIFFRFHASICLSDIWKILYME